MTPADAHPTAACRTPPGASPLPDPSTTPPYPRQPRIPDAYYNFLSQAWRLPAERITAPGILFAVVEPHDATPPGGRVATLWAWRSRNTRWLVVHPPYAEAARDAWRTDLDRATGWPTGLHALVGPDPGHGPGPGDAWALLAWPQTLRPLRRPLTAKRVERLGPRDAPRIPPALRARAERVGAFSRHEFWAIFDPKGPTLAGYLWTRVYTERVRSVGIETVEEYRGQGLAQAVLAIATRDLLADGFVPLYSVRTGNFASQQVAAHVGYLPVARELLLIEQP
jgi:RimJ/RimL family protein N-acetyltransferase